jgi:hypothetical protein
LDISEYSEYSVGKTRDMPKNAEMKNLVVSPSDRVSGNFAKY